MKLASANARRFSTGWLAVGWLAAAWLGSVGCGSSPEPQFYTLVPRAGSELPSAPLQVELRRPGLPGYLDRPQIVRHEVSEKLEFSANARWGAPLQDMVGSILAEDLARRLPGSSVFTEAGAISAAPDALIELDLQRFELTDKGAVELIAQVAVHWPKTSAAPRLDRYALSSPARGVSTAQLVTQMSGLLAELADSIARSISAGPPEAAPAGPSVERAPAQ